MTEKTNLKNKIKIVVIFGGRSGEHAVSLESARFVLRQLDPAKYVITQVGITLDGDWFTGPNALEALKAGDTSSLQRAVILPIPGAGGLYTLDAQDKLSLLTEVDVVFPVLHGTFGEDGTLQGMLEMADLAYVGPGVTGSSTGMDKMIFFDLMRANGIPVVETILVLRSELESDPQAVMDRLSRLGGFPYFVKPANLGSSVGISKVSGRSDLVEGLMEAAAFDRRVIVQKGHKVREIEVSVMAMMNRWLRCAARCCPGPSFTAMMPSITMRAPAL